MDNQNKEPLDHIKGAIEALLFVNEKPVTCEQIRKVLPSITHTDIKKAIAALKEDYASRSAGITIEEIAGGYQMLSNPSYVGYIRSFYKTKHKEKLSKPALETLAIIAYKQPVTRADIELIRGVNSDGVVAHLLEKELIKLDGRKDVPGRPFLYGTTKQFLEYFGLKSLDTLPNLEELDSIITKDEEAVDEEAQADGIPASELDINPMERQKRMAIAKAEQQAQAQAEDNKEVTAVQEVEAEAETELESESETTSTALEEIDPNQEEINQEEENELKQPS